MASPGQTITSISFLKKRPDISHEEFYHHWEHVHGPLVKPWMEKHGIISYTQVRPHVHTRTLYMTMLTAKIHSTPALNQNATPVGPESKDGNVLLEYDGAAVIEIASMDVFTAAFQDEFYKTVIAEDEKRFLDKKVGVLRTRGEAKKIVKVL